MEWEFDPTKYVEKQESIPIAEYKEYEEEEYTIDMPSWPRGEYRAPHQEKTLDEKIDRVIECLISGIDDKDAYMTREEIGIWLAYSNPAVSLANIHKSHAEVLDPLSEKRTVFSREKVLYNADGVCEIMCYSRQPQAGEFLRRFAKAVKQKRGE